MKYVSTRDPECRELGYGQVLLEGLAPDGGLYVPTEIPVLSIDELRAMSNLSYEELFVSVRGRFIGDDIPPLVQEVLADRAYGRVNFPDRTDRVVAPITQIDRVRFIQDLSGGPTAAFKDMALQAVGHDMQYSLSLNSSKLDILGASSGDTISAAGAAVIGRPAMRLFMMLPEHGPTRFQAAQSAVQTEHDNIHHILYPGTFDDCHDIVKMIKSDPEFDTLGALNSINWARIASQVPYYFSGYFQAVDGNIGEEVDFVVPTGNFGNVLAGYIAKQMGLPIRKLIIATNENSVLEPLVNRGDYTVPREVYQTSSPSMDIAVASNYERLFYWLSGSDPVVTAEYMGAIKRYGTAKLADFAVKNSALLETGFWAGTSTHADRIYRIRELYGQPGKFLIDPHTADAVHVSSLYPRSDGNERDSTKIICLSTAKPVKFEDTMNEALGFVPERIDERFVGLEDRAKKVGGFVSLSSIDEVRDFIRTRRVY